MKFTSVQLTVSCWLVIAVVGVAAAREASGQQIGVSTPVSRTVSLSAVNRLQPTAAECKRSKLDFLGQTATGILGSWIVGIGAYAAVEKLDPSGKKVDGDWGYKPNANTAYAIGSWVGSTALVYIAGRRGCGSLGRTAVGTGIPSVVLLLGRDVGALPLFGSLLIAPLQGIGGALMFPRH